MMQLSPDLFARLTGSAVPLAGSGVGEGAERRRHGRLPLGKRAQVRTAGGPWQTIMLRDISVVGIGMQADVPLKAGQAFTLRVIGADEVEVVIECVVSRCERGGFGGVAFFVGSTFERLLDATDVSAAPTLPAGQGTSGHPTFAAVRVITGLFHRSGHAKSTADGF